MANYKSLSVLFASFLSISLVAAQLVVPALDPFYAPPAGFAATAPGTILRTRRVQTAFLGLIPDPVQAWQLLYRTRAVDGSAIADVTTVFKPTNALTDRFVSFQTAYDGAARSGVCDPSYNYLLGSPQIDLISSAEYFLLQSYLQSGYIVSSADYEGSDATFGAGRLAGYGTLDSMRAVINFKSTLGLSTSSPKIVGYGYSGGAIATGWAAGLQPTYAKELNINGWAMGGTPANLTGTALFIDGTLFAGFLPQALTGLDAPSSYAKQLDPVYARYLTAYGKGVVAAAKQICGAQNILTFSQMSIRAPYFQTYGRDVQNEPAIQSVLRQQTMGVNRNETPTAPDEIIPYSNATNLFNSWCSYGASVHFTTVAAGGHATTEILGFPGAMAFVQSAFAGTTTPGCSQDTIDNDALSPTALGANLEPELVGLINVLLAAGKGDANIKADPSVLGKKVTA
ncbi:hypothetical protein B0A48_06166 [Cryoendolithus antarcticus]|uniref:LIP-domain-containing protein n=1 Tax=Cryoendolithus antarcticus TaxID=1507870 RepID=A0A1V8TA75_9PEZI|nr:hypothetical protein B0A48_06166 [Cryoendolithus antarcticus]